MRRASARPSTTASSRNIASEAAGGSRRAVIRMSMPSAPFALAAALAAIVGCTPKAQAQAVDFSGKTLTVVSSFAPGGGYDIYGRLCAAHVAHHLAGQPAVVVRNMPGAGGLIGANYLFNVAPKDGTTVGVV